MPDFRDSFTAREVCEGMLSQINVFASLPKKYSSQSTATNRSLTLILQKQQPDGSVNCPSLRAAIDCLFHNFLSGLFELFCASGLSKRLKLQHPGTLDN